MTAILGRRRTEGSEEKPTTYLQVTYTHMHSKQNKTMSPSESLLRQVRLLRQFLTWPKIRSTGSWEKFPHFTLTERWHHPGPEKLQSQSLEGFGSLPSGCRPAILPSDQALLAGGRHLGWLCEAA